MYESRFYELSPALIQEMIISGRSFLRKLLRDGRSFQKEYYEVMRTQFLDYEALAYLQKKRLKRIICHAALSVPYYRDVCKKSGICLKNMDEDSLDFFPVLEKKDIHEAGRSMLSESESVIFFSDYSSGSTGVPVRIFRNISSIVRERAFISRQSSWAGVRQSDRKVWLRGDQIIPSYHNVPPYWRHDRSGNIVIVSSYHISKKSSLEYLKKIESFDPVVIEAYPSAIYHLSRLLLDIGLKYRGRNLKAVITSSETLAIDHRYFIKKFFGCPVYDLYGSVERVAAIHTCEQGNYHLLSDYSHVELKETTNGDHELIGTGFDNRLMPLIRYRLEDTVVVADKNYRCPCGRAFPVIERINGRIDDTIVTPDGRYLGMLINMFNGLTNVMQTQVIQESRYELAISIVPVSKIRTPKPDEIMTRVRRIIGDDMKISIKFLTSIPRGNNRGKLCTVIKKIK